MIKVGDKVKIDEKSYFFTGENLFDIVAINGLIARIENSEMTLFVLVENLQLVADKETVEEYLAQQFSGIL